MEYYLLQQMPQTISWSKLNDDILNIIHFEYLKDYNEIKQNKELALTGYINCRSLADKIRPENVTYNSITNNYSVTKQIFLDRNPLLCPWNIDNCLYPLLLTMLYLGTKKWIHTINMELPPRLAQSKLKFLFSNQNIRNIINIPPEIYIQLEIIITRSKMFPMWELLPDY